MKNIKVKSVYGIDSYLPQNNMAEIGHNRDDVYTLEILDVPDSISLTEAIRTLNFTALVQIAPTFRIKWDRIGFGKIVMNCDD